MVNEFKVGDQVAHEEHGYGWVEETREPCQFGLDTLVRFGSLWPLYWLSSEDLRPRNFLSKIAEEQSKVVDCDGMTYEEACEVAKKMVEPKTIGDMIKRSLAEKNDDPVFPSNILADKTVDQHFKSIFNDSTDIGAGAMYGYGESRVKTALPKTVDQQFNEVFKDALAHGTGIMKDGKHVPHSEVFRQPTVTGVDMASGPDVGFEAIATPQGFKEFITDAYGIKRDPVTLLEIESDGLVKISSIRDSVREIS